jgi:hypothetical protein
MMLMGRVRAGGAVMVGVERSAFVAVCGGVLLLVAAAVAVAAVPLAWADLERVMMGSRGLIVALVGVWFFLSRECKWVAVVQTGMLWDMS